MLIEFVSQRTYRRFLLGTQGLWPGRRFVGLPGVEAALRQMQAVQLDPLTMVARSQDIAMYGRVAGYQPDLLPKTAYEKRKAFDYGGWLMMYPMSDFPYWRMHMEQRRHLGLRYESFRHPPQEILKFILEELRERGPLGNRDFEGARVKGWSYRGRKETSVALFYLWLIGEVMISSRKGFDRVYDLRERVLPSRYDFFVPDDEIIVFMCRKIIAFMGMLRETRLSFELSYYLHRQISKKTADNLIHQLLERKLVSRVKVEGSRDSFLVLNSAKTHLSALETGRVPAAWSVKDTTTEEEVTLLAPLEIVSARGRAKKVFDFEYLWEVYKPAHLRRWGYYTLPILYGDDLVARLDPKLDRSTNTLEILGFWLEQDAPTDERFASALAKGFQRFADMTGAVKINLGGMKQGKLRAYLKKKLKI